MDPKLRLHRARVERSIELSRISALTALSPRVVRTIDEGRFADLPGGLYARSYVRAFAEAVGVPGDQALKEVEHLLPGAPDPLPVPKGNTLPSPVEWLARQVPTYGARLTELREAASSRLRALAGMRQHAPQLGVAAASPAHVVTQDDSDQEAPPFGSESALALRLRTIWRAWRTGAARQPRRLGAAAIDASLLLVSWTLTTIAVAWACGVGPDDLLRQAGLAMSSIYLLQFGTYFLVFQGVGGRTPGMTAMRWRADDLSRPKAGPAEDPLLGFAPEDSPQAPADSPQLTAHS